MFIVNKCNFIVYNPMMDTNKILVYLCNDVSTVNMERYRPGVKQILTFHRFRKIVILDMPQSSLPENCVLAVHIL